MENIVIGSGPAGRLGSLELGKLEKEVLLIEKKHIAGTCLNEGCMVVCALTDVCKYLDSTNRFNAHGFIKSQVEFSYSKLVEKIKETQEIMRYINQKENESVNNQIIYGEAELIDDLVYVNGESYSYDNLLISTGARPFIPDIPGKEYGLTNQDILNIDDVPEKLNIIGSGIIACEIANIYSQLGSEVKIFARSKFLKEIDSDMREYIKEKLLQKVSILENIDVLEVGKNKVITHDNEYEGVPFFATGRTPNSEIVEDVVKLNSNKTIKVNSFMQTNIDNIYAAGDVIGGHTMTPVARMEGITAARNMAGYLNKIDYNCIPQSISLNMEVGFVKDEKNSNDLVDITVPGTGGPGAFWNVLTGDTGITKMSFDEKENKIGKITSISPSSTDDISYLSYLMRIDEDLDKFDEFLEVHPSTDANYKIIKSMWL
ncbi:NAD(P)/FAD-dependent oxidoreductase [Methanobrevibacter sp. OttesenSCG-928-K11]|nr:NAD(P)/FAD-dependent oxidoreductase [Methanobrevibacter sp. OttesenSCG-928-K11]MDL2270985.1 NAD(P)/FAD-dependent oxidoreductase [Methanobrevibacter sp. OttesenSCG-928-I08]